MGGDRPKVVVLGGGVAGMSAAHELVERGFSVEVFEAKAIPGGKARSVSVPGSGKDGRRDLPGEHGFRFFPRFYRHVTDTMRRIPFGTNPRGVYDNLVDTTRAELATYYHPPVVTTSRCPRSLADVEVAIHALCDTDVGVSGDDERFFSGKAWQIMTSCQERRLAEYEQIGWWDFVGAASRSRSYQDFYGRGLTRSLVAAKAETASTRTIGDIGVQLLFDWLEPGMSSDRVLNGPTNESWIDPWLSYLRARGVTYNFQSEVVAINCEGGRVRSATVARDGRKDECTGDYFVAAMPIDIMTSLIDAPLLALAPELANVQALAMDVAWMNGIQFYLRRDVPLVHGHQLFISSQWALTSISQHNFWPTFDFANCGDGGVRGILSVDVSEWGAPGLNGKAAHDCTRDEIAAEVWAELKRSLDFGSDDPLTDDDLHSWFLDPDIVSADPATGRIAANREPLLVNLVNRWHLRPEAATAIPNLFLASDYVRTYTDLATMEGANEAARRAVNAILTASGSTEAPCALWNLHEPLALALWREHDLERWRKGLPWDGRIFG